ncbi:MAG: 3-dehydroquinate synthase [Clostridia bacterium]|nr:3-dehydroquinate synthase [Clostridia bacterium]
MKTIKVNASKNYEVLIGSELIKDTGTLVKRVLDASKIMVISDDIVVSLYGEIVRDSLLDAGYEVDFFVIENGEKSKSLPVYAAILEYLADNAYTRTDAIVALGGGVVGDLAGFVAATYLRGISFVQIPTTLLAQIDSSVGGKTAIDLPSGKNLVGAFWQPSLVIADVATLNSLSDKEIENGLGELIKYGVLLGGEAYELISAGINEDNLERLIELSVAYKRDIVEADEKENGVRTLLNLGHTIAHGIEKLSDYTFTHGKAVALGLWAVAKAQYNKGLLSKMDYKKIEELYDYYGIETTLPYSIADLVKVACIDKKATGKNIKLVVPEGIGNCKIVTIALDQLEEYFK